MDALLGALALGDIGKHFPDNDNTYKDIDSMLLLKKVFALISEKGYKIGNIDSIIIAQAPKLLSFIPSTPIFLSFEYFFFRFSLPMISGM